MRPSSTRPRLYLSHDPALDWLCAFEFGRVGDDQPPQNWRGISEDFGYLLDSPGGRCIGFSVLRFSGFDPEAAEHEEIWSGPRFDVPVLGLSAASAGETALAADAHFGGEPSLNRALFQSACAASGEEALALWRACLESGDGMAHFALGYTLFELGRFREAYRHLRHYAEISPAGAWNWCWLGRAAAAIGAEQEAREAYRRAIALSEECGEETDAPELLTELDAAR